MHEIRIESFSTNKWCFQNFVILENELSKFVPEQCRENILELWISVTYSKKHSAYEKKN